MASGNPLEASIGEAQAAVSSSAGYQKSKWAQRLDRTGDMALATSGVASSPTVQIVQGSAVFSLVKDQVSNFAQNSKTIMAMLDELGKAHPFISVAVSIFKGALTLELTRRDNDQKVLALNAKMCDMMSVLGLLKDLATDEEGMKTVEGRLRQRLDAIIDSIKRCAKLCDSYQKRHTAVKFFTSIKWKDKFTDVAAQFDVHKADLQLDLQIHVSVTAADMKVTLAAVHQDVSAMMTLVFEKMRSPEEREFAALVAIKGGEEKTIANDALLGDIISKSKPRSARMVKQKQDDDDADLTLSTLRKEIAKDPDEVVKEDAKAFDQKFSAVLTQLEEVKQAIRRESDRVIAIVQGGPHERIVNRDLYYLWKEMGWKGSVKARHLVMAMRDHFGEPSQRAAAAQAAALEKIRAIVDASHPGTSSEKVEEVADAAGEVTSQAAEIGANEDSWALSLIKINRIQSLLEALDHDLSTFVTISEVNSFSAQSPVSWSLPHWIAYWTVGVELTVNWYLRLIIRDLVILEDAASEVLPANRRVCGDFIASDAINFIDDILSSLDDTSMYDDIDWERNFMFGQFKHYVFSEQRRMGKMLADLRFNIDQENTLTLVTGGVRPETYVLPLAHLFMQRVIQIFRLAKATVIHDAELDVITSSIYVIRSVVWDRLRVLKTVYKMQDLNEREQLRKFSFGMYNFVSSFEGQMDSVYWTRRVEWDIDVSEPDDAVVQDESRSIPPELDTGNYVLVSSPENSKTSQQDDDSPQTARVDQDESWGAFDTAASIATEQSSALAAGSTDVHNTGTPAQIVTPSSEADRPTLHALNMKVALAEDATQQRTANALFYGPQDEEEDLGCALSAHLGFAFEEEESDDKGASLLGHWGGEYAYAGDLSSDGLVSFNVVSHDVDSGEFRGSGRDAIGDFIVEGQISGTKISFLKEYVLRVGGEEVKWAYQGHFDSEEQLINGTWGEPRDGSSAKANEDEDAHEHVEEDLAVPATPPCDRSASPSTISASSGESSILEGGTFFLKRKPISFFLFRPSEAAFLASRPRALWTWACDAVRSFVRTRSGTWSWDVLRNRRDRRRRYIALVNAQRTQWRLNPTQQQEFTELVKTIHPDDLQFWHALALFQRRRRIVHNQTCDGCPSDRPEDDSLIQGARCFCIQCSKGEIWYTMDLCLNCIQKPVHRDSDPPKYHTIDHNLLQFRTVRHRRALYEMQRKALDYIDSSETPADDGGEQTASHLCHLCHEAVQWPVWRCLNCTDDTFVCFACNAQIEEQRPWLFEYQPSLGDGHHWSHTLVSSPPRVEPEPPALGMEERLARLEIKFDQRSAEQAQAQALFADDLNARMTRLEAMLSRLIEAHTSAS